MAAKTPNVIAAANAFSGPLAMETKTNTSKTRSPTIQFGGGFERSAFIFHRPLACGCRSLPPVSPASTPVHINLGKLIDIYNRSIDPPFTIVAAASSMVREMKGR